MATILPFDANTEPRLQLPPPAYGKAAKDSEHARKLRDWQNSRIPYTHAYRIRQCSIWRKADLFDESIQWLIKSYNSDPTRTQHYAALSFDENDRDAIPLPVYNEFSGRIENETARLGRPEYKPYVRPQGQSPDIKTRTAAKLSEKILQQALDDMRWNETEDMGELHMPLYGGWYLKSYWDASWEKTTKVPVEGAVRCPDCDFKLASAEIPYDRAVGTGPTDSFPEDEVVEGLHPQFPEAIEKEEPELPLPLDAKPEDVMPKFTAKKCLTCPDHEEQGMVDEPVTDELGAPILDEITGEPATKQAFGKFRAPGGPKLEPFTPVDDELNAQDYLGRDLGDDVPLGEWKLRTCMPYDVFVENLGIGVRINEVSEVTEVHVESLEWICNRYENGYLVKAENPRALMEYHQVAGERGLRDGTDSFGVSLFNAHSRVKETHKKPWREEIRDRSGKGTGKWKMNKGRSIVIASDIILFDGDLLMESKVNPGVFIERVRYDYVPWKLRSGGGEHAGISMSEGLFDPQESINETHSQIQDAQQTEGSPKWAVARGMNWDYERGGNAGDHWLYDVIEGSNAKPERIESNLINAQIYTGLNDDNAFMDRHANLNEVEGGNVPAGITAALALQILAEQSGERRRPRIRRIREMLGRVHSHGLALLHELVREPRSYFEKNDRNEWAEHCWIGADLMGQTDVQIEIEPEVSGTVQERQLVNDGMANGSIDMTNRRTRRIAAKKIGLPKDLYEKDDLQEESSEREYRALMDDDEPPIIDKALDDPEAHVDRHGVDMLSEEWRELEKEANWNQVEMLLWDWELAYDDQPGPPVIGVDPMTGQPGPQPGPMIPGLAQQVAMTMPAVKLLELVIQEAWKMILNQAGYVPRPHEQKAFQKVMRMRAHLAAHVRLLEQKAQMAQAGIPQAAAPEAPASEPAMAAQ